MLIDAHTHAFLPEDLVVLAERLALLDEDLDREDPNKWQVHQGGTVETLVDSMARAGADRWVLLPVTASKGRVGEINRWAAQVEADNPEGICFGTLHPAGDAAKDLAELLELGLKGVKLHPFVQRINLETPEAAEVFRLLAGERLPVVLDTIHTHGLYQAKPHMEQVTKFFGYAGCQPHEIAALARAHPELPVIAAHMGSLYGWQYLDELIALDNVFFDMSYVNGLLTPEQVVELIRKKGPERILYGTDAPWREPTAFRQWFEELELTSGEREMIAAGNLLELLGLA